MENRLGMDRIREKAEVKRKMTSELEGMFADYSRELIRRGYGISRSSLLKLDQIDLCGVSDIRYVEDAPQSILDTDKTVFNREMLAENYWYCYIPCFLSGVFRLNGLRYLHYTVTELDTINRSYHVRVNDYIMKKAYWEPCMQVEADITFPLMDKEALLDPETMPHAWCAAKISNLTMHPASAPEYYRMISIDEFGWTDRQKRLWETQFLPVTSAADNLPANENNADMEAAGIRSGWDATGLYDLHVFLTCTVLSNEILMQHRPKAVRGKNKGKAKVQAGEVQEGKRKVIRNVGPINITSEKPPKPSTRETVIRYKTPEWKARGGVRHMKDGRVIPFRESVRKRKCLQGKADGNVPQTVIRVKKKAADSTTETGNTESI